MSLSHPTFLVAHNAADALMHCALQRGEHCGLLITWTVVCVSWEHGGHTPASKTIHLSGQKTFVVFGSLRKKCIAITAH